ncbi:MAG: histidine kinase dimerization/phospho-acceptor domain-containing protein [Thalassolituus sp.]
MQEYWLYAAVTLLIAVIIALLSKLAQQRDELYEAQQESRRSRLLWDRYPGVVVEIRPDGTVIRISSADISGLNEAANGRRVQDLLSGQSRSVFQASLAQALETFAPVQYELTAKGSGGQELWFRNELIPVLINGHLKSLLIVASDITDLHLIQSELTRQKEMAERQSEVKSRFLANMSHEIRTPLNGMLGVMALLEATPLTPRQRSHFDTLQQGADHLLAIVNDVLDLSRIESGNLVLTHESFDLSELLHRVAAIVHAKASEKRLALQLFIDDDVPEYVRGDPLRLSQILLNLLNNAVKFTDRGHVILRVVVPSADRDTLRFSVEDTGIGIEAAKAQHLFGEYALAHGDVSEALGGTGLGFMDCRQFFGKPHAGSGGCE